MRPKICSPKNIALCLELVLGVLLSHIKTCDHKRDENTENKERKQEKKNWEQKRKNEKPQLDYLQ